MEFLIAAVVLLPLLSLSIHLLLNRKGLAKSGNENSCAISILLFFNVFMILSGLLLEGSGTSRLMFDLMLSLIPASMLVFHVFGNISTKSILWICALMSAVVVSVRILICTGIISGVSSCMLVWSSVFVVVVLLAVVCAMVLARIRDLPRLMKQGSLWSYLWICSDWIYLLSITLIVMASLLMSDFMDNYAGVHIVVADILMAIALSGLYIRKYRNSPFVLMQRHEKVILESIKVSRCELVEASMFDDSGYRVVYERLTEYFDKEKPYLRSDLTINDLVKVIYSNKLYISRAISLCTGRNFRQFVNYYRIQYSCDFYRENPTVKIVELAQICGFNTVASFNMAFRLYMNETPGEWCRKERVKLSTSGEWRK